MSDDLFDDTHAESNPEETPSIAPKAGLISKVLAPAIRLWLKSQTEQLENLTLSIQAGDRQLLSGQIPRVEVAATSAIYQGIHLSQLQLTASDIQINLGQVMRGKALKLLAAFPIDIQMVLSEDNLNQSLTAAIVRDAVSDFLLNLLGHGEGQKSLVLTNLHSQLQDDSLLLLGSLPANSSGESTEIAIRTGIHLTQPNKIQLHNPTWLPHAKAKRGMAIAELNGYSFDLGPETHLSSIKLESGQISCTGRLMVLP